MSRVILMVKSIWPPLLYNWRCSSDGLIVAFETIELCLAQLIVEHKSDRSQLLLTAPPLLPSARHLPICAIFCLELFGVPSCVGSGHWFSQFDQFSQLKHLIQYDAHILRLGMNTLPYDAMCWTNSWSLPPRPLWLSLIPSSLVRPIQLCLGAANSKCVSISYVLVKVLGYLSFPLYVSWLRSSIGETNMLYSELYIETISVRASEYDEAASFFANIEFLLGSSFIRLLHSMSFRWL